MSSVCNRVRCMLLGSISAAALFSFSAAAAQAADIAPSDCTVPAATQVFAGDPHFYYDAGAVSVTPDSPQQIPGLCVNVPHPTLRVTFAGGDSGARVSITATFPTDDGGTVTLPVGRLSVVPGLSRILHIHGINQAARQGNVGFMLNFTVDGGAADISDTWVDPWGG